MKPPAASGGFQKSQTNEEELMKCPMCPKDVRTDHMSRHFSTHVSQFISDMSEEQKAKHIETKNVIIQSPTGLKDIKPWCYCLVCKKIAYDEIQGQNAGPWMRYHKKCPCTSKWNQVQHLFNGGVLFRGSKAAVVDKSEVNFLKGKIQVLEAQITRVLEDLPVIMNQLSYYEAKDRRLNGMLADIIAYLNHNEEEKEEEEEEEEEKPVEVPEPEPVIVPTKKVIRKATKAVGGHQAQEII